ncbi:MAG: hypothetical protein LBQ81_13315 [Zoogloeaceae bacterium]|jgi:hypothetical protein|nr:hypothetical protein [Zoogloeaceae bacterium]
MARRWNCAGRKSAFAIWLFAPCIPPQTPQVQHGKALFAADREALLEFLRSL